MRVIRTIEQLRRNCKVHTLGCWEFLRADGTPFKHRTVPSIGKPLVQIAIIAVQLSGRTVPEGHYIRRMPHCIRYCCNPNHLSVVSSKQGERRGQRSNNPKGNPGSLKPNGGRPKGATRSTLGKPSSNPYGRAGKPKILPVRNDQGGFRT